MNFHFKYAIIRLDDCSLLLVRNMYGYGSAIVAVLVLVSSIGAAIAATTATPSSIKSSRSVAARSASAANTSAKKVVTFRQSFGNTEEQCQCVVFHLCDQNNVISVPTADNQ